MSLAREINKELDNILKIKAEVKRVNAEITDEDIFTNKFYVNDFVQDKICAEEQIEQTLNNSKPNNIQNN